MFPRGDWELLYDSWLRYFKGKNFSRWMGPYEVGTVFSNKIVRLITINEAYTPLIVNGHHLRSYHHPVSKDFFIKHLSDNYGFEIVSAKNSSSSHLVKKRR